MATSYHYRSSSVKEAGPVSFRELVRLVRDDALRADDLVKADWETEWRPAAEVVGLFHTAGRADVLERWEQEQIEKQRQLDAVTNSESETAEFEELLATQGDFPDRGAIFDRLEQLEQERLDRLRAEQAHGKPESKTQQQIDFLIQSASLEREELERKRNQKSIISCFTVGTMQAMFRIAMAIAVSNLTTYLVFLWSQREMQRFPDLRSSPDQTRVFPIYGKCSEFEFLFLMFDTVIISAIAGYGLARLLEFFVDE